jgi:hypothetical protein
MWLAQFGMHNHTHFFLSIEVYELVTISNTTISQDLIISLRYLVIYACVYYFFSNNEILIFHIPIIANVCDKGKMLVKNAEPDQIVF